MAKIPVGATVAHAYSFTIKNFLNILGAMWLPILALLAAFVIAGALTMNMGIDVSADPASVLRAAPLFLLAYVVAILCSLMPWIAVTEKALGLREGPVFFYFSFGKPLWRLLGSFLLLVLVLAGGGIAIGLIAAVIGAALGVAAASGDGAGLGLTAVAVPVLVIALWAFFIYALVRLTFLLLPVTVAERRVGIWGSWKLMRGNFWRAFLVLLCIFIPILIVEIVVLVMLGAPLVPPAEESPEAAMRFLVETIDFYISLWYLIVPIFLAIGVIMTGVFVGAQSFAYRTLTAASGASG